MMGLAFHSHPYGHETIGYREDIESYTVEKLNAFYKKFYAPNNATLIIVGDITEAEMLAGVTKHFTKLKPSHTLAPRESIDEPLQEGVRKVVVKKPSTTNMLSIGVRHEGFPSTEWFETMIVFELLGGGEDSILHKKLVDTGLASSIHTSLEPTYDENLGILHIKLTEKTTHDEIYARVRAVVDSLSTKEIAPYLKKIIARVITSEFSSRDSSLGFVSELVEYVSAGDWEHFFDTEKTLSAITPKQIHEKIKLLFSEDLLTIGYFVGTKRK
jgi:zinc protease